MYSMTGARARSVLLAAALTPLALGLAAGSSVRTTTWTVSPGGPITGHAPKTVLLDTTTGQAGIPCIDSVAHAKLTSGSGLPGAGLGSLTGVTFNSGCFTLTASHFPWQVNAQTYATGTGTTSGTITGVHLVFTDPTFCDFVADGTGANAGNGTVHFRYVNSTGKLKIVPTGGNLHIYQVNGCGGAFHNGDAASFSATYAITPPQTITAP
jgi:hypothetical protein